MSKIRANFISSKNDNKAVEFTSGIVVGGAVTATNFDFNANTFNGDTYNGEVYNVGTGVSIGNPAANELSISTNNIERIHVNNIGDIGIGKSSITTWGGSIPTIEIKGRSPTGGLSARSGAIAFESGSGSDGYAILWGNEGGIEYYSSATNRATTAYGCKFTSAGNLAFASGKGIDFSATSDGGTSVSELLDDYEEGSWAPTGTADLQGYSGPRYIKIGRLVTITVRLDFATNSSSTRADIGGLPFTPDPNISNSAMGSAVGETSYTGSDRPFAGVEVTSVIRFRINGNTSMTYANWSNKSVRLSLTYFSET